MDELKIVKLAELRSRMSGIPVKLFVTFLITAGAFWNFSMDKFKENIPQNLFAFLILYGVLSYVWVCIKLTGNWIIGIVVAIALIFLWTANLEKMGEVWSTVIGCVICFGGPVLDVWTIVRYFRLKKQLFAQARTEYEYYGEYDEDDDDEAEYEYEERQSYQKQEAPSPGFFSDCKDTASIKRRYRDLCKVYHPDSGNGSSEVFNRITEEYNRLMEGA